MSVEIYFSNLDLETKLEVLDENEIKYLSIDGGFNNFPVEMYHTYLNNVANSKLSASISPLAIYEIDLSVDE